jgi:uncharacterized protein
MSEAPVSQAPADPRTRRRRRLPTGLELLLIALVVVFLTRPLLAELTRGQVTQTFATIFVSIVLQAIPFLVFGVVLSGLIAALVPPRFMARALPRRPGLAVPVAGVAGGVLPGCECGSVPIAARLVASGTLPAAALTFLLSAPAINPVVIVSTAVAFPGQPMMAVARFVASLLTAVVVGLVWTRLGRESWTAAAKRRVFAGETRWATFRDTVRHDFLQAGGFLVIGGAVAAALQVILPRSFVSAVAGYEIVSALVLALLAVVLSICSEADAFVAATLTEFSLTSRLVFLVVGPVIDIKLYALQVGVFGKTFANRFAPLTFVVAVVVALVVGAVLL